MSRRVCPDGCGLDVPAMSAFGNLGSVFIGFLRTERAGVKLRLYNVTGDHRLSGSTVTVDTLVNEEIPILDMTEREISEELAVVRDYLKD